MRLIPVKEHPEENPEFISDPHCQESLYMSTDFYKKVGFTPPWICYYVKDDENLVGCAGFKGRPVNNSVEVAYGTFDKFRNKGIGTRICKILVDLSIQTDPSVRITARTLPENNYSTKILKKNRFNFLGDVYDLEDGNLWEWEYQKESS